MRKIDFDLSDMIGKPYADFGRGPEEYDCAGVVLEVLRRSGRAPQDFVLDDQSAAENEWREVGGMPVLSVLQSATKRGSGYAEHLAVYIGRGLIIHATDNGVSVESVDKLKEILSIVEYVGK